MKEIATDETCNGFCRCPECDGPAHWSLHAKRHACADPDCRTEFREHNAPPYEKGPSDDPT